MLPPTARAEMRGTTSGKKESAGWLGTNGSLPAARSIFCSARRAGKILNLKLRSLLTRGRAVSSSSAAAILGLERMHIPVRGPFVTPARHHVFLVNDCLLTEEEVVALHEAGQLRPHTAAKCLIDLKRSQAPFFSRPRRSERIVLRLPLVVCAEMPNGEPLSTPACTVIVNAHGGLLESPFRMTAGQEITLNNPQSGKRVRCRIVSVQASSPDSVRAAFEFDHHSPWFWPLSFPPLDWAAAAGGGPCE
jgi:hypothetical protein